MNKKNKTLPICELVNDKNFPIVELFNKANRIQQIDTKLKGFLDPCLKNHFELANIKNDSVVLLVTSSNWATRLRYNIPTILDVLNNQLNFTDIKTVRIKVKTLIPENSQKIKNSISLSKASSELLRDVADNFTDPEIRNCFIKLSKNIQK